MLKKLLSITALFAALNSQADIDIIDGNKMLESVNQQIVNINTAELDKILNEDPNVVLIDVRTPFELKVTGTINRGQNINIARGWIEFQIADHVTSKDTPIIVYCGRNLRSPLAAKTLENMGYTNVKNYSDGFFAWQDELNPVSMSDHDH
jgi:rhodanese-related sulfurtransferase